MKCHNCPKPAMFRLGDPETGIPVCADCNLLVQEAVDRQNDRLADMQNYLADHIDDVVGLPRGSTPRMRRRLPMTPIKITGGTVNNHIRIEGANIGVLNTGHIGQIGTAVGLLQGSADEKTAAALREFTEKIAASSDADTATKNKIVELLSGIAAEATIPKEQRRGAIGLALVAEIANICSGVASLASLWATYGPAFKAFFVG